RVLLFLVRFPVELLAELFETTLKSASKNVYGLSASSAVEKKARISSGGAVSATSTEYESATKRVPARWRSVTSAVHSEQRSAPLVAASTTEQEIRRRILYKQSRMVLVKNLSHYSILFRMLASPLEHVQTEILRKTTKVLEVAQEKYGKELVKALGGNLGGDLKKVILPDMRGDYWGGGAAGKTVPDAARLGDDAVSAVSEMQSFLEFNETTAKLEAGE
ncbi:hypothetical protein JG688_00011904, partial [Phytophthora aleatoria]